MTRQPSPTITTVQSPYPGIRTQDIVSQRSAGIYHIFEIIENRIGRHIQIRCNLIANHFALAFEFGFRELRGRQKVYQQVQSSTCIAVRKGGINHCIFLGGEGVQLATHGLHTIDNMPRTTAMCTLENGMLHKMRQSALAGCKILVTAAGIDRKTAIPHDAAFKVQMDYAQAVVKYMVCRFDHYYL